MKADQILRDEGESDPKPFKLYRVTEGGDFLLHVAEFATQDEAMKFHRRLDWHYAIYLRRKKIWPLQSKEVKP